MAWMLALEELVNRAIRLDAGAAAALEKLAGRSLGVEVRGLGLRFLVFLAADGVHLAGWSPDDSEAPDTTISGPPLALARLATSSEPFQTLFRGEVEVAGDIRLLERVRAVLAAADIDWEEPLDGIMGDPLGHQLARGIRGLGRWSRKSRESLELDTRDFLEEESRLVARRDEVRDFNIAVDVLRDDLARLEARVERLTDPRDDSGREDA